MLPEPSRQVSESDNVQFSKQQNPHSVVHPALQELINIVTVDSLNKFVRELASDELQHLHH